MDDVRNPQADESAGPHLRLLGRDSLPEAFVPMHLILQPGGASIDVDRPDVLVGRHTECDVRLPLPDVSRRHCRLRFVEGGWQVIDLSSLNGTQVNGQPVAQSQLKQGDQLKIGGFHFEVSLVAGKPRHGGHVDSILETLAGGKRKAS